MRISLIQFSFSSTIHPSPFDQEEEERTTILPASLDDILEAKDYASAIQFIQNSL